MYEGTGLTIPYRIFQDVPYVRSLPVFGNVIEKYYGYKKDRTRSGVFEQERSKTFFGNFQMWGSVCDLRIWKPVAIKPTGSQKPVA